MLAGCQTHFGLPIGSAVLLALEARRFQLARIDAGASDTLGMLEMVLEVQDAGLIPYVTVTNYEQVEALPVGCRCEWKNEPDIALGRPAPIPPLIYATELLEAAKVAARNAVEVIGAPVVSNLNKRGTDYILAVIAGCGGTLPDNVFGVTHRYGDGSYEQAHKLNKWWPFGAFQSREDELRWFKATIGEGRPWGVSEWGYPSTDGLTEQDQAERMRLEWDLYTREGAAFAIVYQLNDGPGQFGIDHFGLRRFDGTWKPSADTVPSAGPDPVPVPDEDTDMLQATPMLSKALAIPVPGRPGVFTHPYPRSGPTVLSVQGDGSWQTRPAGTAGAWEVFRIEGNRAVFFETDGCNFGLPIGD
jgi:hypothetical protein